MLLGDGVSWYYPKKLQGVAGTTLGNQYLLFFLCINFRNLIAVDCIAIQLLKMHEMITCSFLEFLWDIFVNTWNSFF